MPSPDNPASADPLIQPVSDWLIACGLTQVSIADLLDGVCVRLNRDLGFQLLRGNIALRTLHPVIDAVTYVWWRDTGIETTAYPLEAPEDDDEWQKSPIRPLVEADDGSLHRTRLDRGDAVARYPIYAEFRERGATEHIARLVGFGVDGKHIYNSGVVTTWVTDREGGFLDSEADILERLAPRLSLAVKSALGYEISANLLDSYVGHNAGRRILDGAFRRGTFQLIPAAIVFADLRGFTSLSDRLPHEEVAGVLNACFDAMVDPVTRRGGEVLKFLGDGVLAVFDRRERDDGDLTRGALDAAREAIAGVATVTAPDTGAPMALDIALHLGDVLYGNVGTADRLDFTVIGPAVNEASRIEGLCDKVGYPLLISPSFAAASSGSGYALTSVGHHQLRGVEAAQELFTLEDGRG